MERISEVEFKNLILEGLATDVFIAERAYSMFKTISDNALLIQETRGYSELFNCTQAAFKDQFLIAVARLFDSKSKHNRVRSVFEVLDFLARNSFRLPEIREWPNLFSIMKDIGFNQEALKLVLSESNEEDIAKEIVRYFEGLLQNLETKRYLLRLKEIRDKSLSHNEYKDLHSELIETIDPVTFKNLYGLIDIAKNLIGVIGWAYMNYVFKHNGKYHLTDDAHRPSKAFNKLIKQISNANEIQ